MSRRFTAADEGKRVVTADGTHVGSIVRIRGGDAYVAPVPGLLRGCGSWLTGTWEDRDAYPLDGRAVARVGGTEVVLETRAEPSATRPASKK
jgi:hypothetical protein